MSHPNVSHIARGTAAFAFDLYRQLNFGGSNFFVAPFSISNTMGMVHAGADGETAAQIERTLHFDSDTEQLHESFVAALQHLRRIQQRGNVQLHSATGLWPHEECSMRGAYLDTLERVFRTTVTTVDFNDTEGSRQIINAWVQGKTNQRITELLPPGAIDPLTLLVLTDATYFNGPWAEPFDRDDTEHLPFRMSETESITVPMMQQISRFGYAETPDLQLLELPYVESDLSMVFLLPKTLDGLSHLEQTISEAEFFSWTSRLEERDVRVVLPRFRITTGCELGTTLEEMGVTDVFDSDRADFSLMDGGRRPLCISKVFHQTFIDVNEEGTEAAAATAGVMESEEGDEVNTPVLFQANHPFIAALMERSCGILLFLGCVVNPEATP